MVSRKTATSEIVSIAISVVCLLTILGCGKEEHRIVNDNNSVLIPLKVGNEWFGTEIESDSSGNVLSSSSLGWRIGSDTLISGERWFWMQTPGEDGELSNSMLVTNRADGVWIQDQREPYLMFKYPAAVGDRYDAHAYRPDTMIVNSVGEQIETPAGAFACYLYHLIPWDTEDIVGVDFWLFPGVGFVRTGSQGWSSTLTWTLDSLLLK